MVATTIEFATSNLQPPVYVAGSWDSRWTPVEMESNKGKNGAFSCVIDLKPGCYQYKFRLGPGDWWVNDESAPMARDDLGNLNNVLNVEQAVENHTHATAQTEVRQPTKVTESSSQKAPAQSQQLASVEAVQKTRLIPQSRFRALPTSSDDKDEDESKPMIDHPAPIANGQGTLPTTDEGTGVPPLTPQTQVLPSDLTLPPERNTEHDSAASQSVEKVNRTSKSSVSVPPLKPLRREEPRRQSFMIRLLCGCFRQLSLVGAFLVCLASYWNWLIGK